MKPVFFATSAELRAWLEEHHENAKELWVGFYKKGSGRPSITWPEAVDQALCFGWIDGVRKSIDDVSYTNRFTPRSPRSTWSAVNIARVRELTDLGLMRPAGLQAFEARADERSAIYSYEQRRNPQLEEEHERRFRADEKAWEWFQSQPPSYRKAALWWVISAKREDTRTRRLATLIDDCAHGRKVKPLTPPRASR
jgi:uncharacterized protein YdeI (YjbR/CyaY-like superfamily)